MTIIPANSHGRNLLRCVLCLADYNLTGREIKYIYWHFWCGMTCNQIAKADGRTISRQAVNLVMQKAYGKIRQNKGPVYYAGAWCFGVT